MKVGIIGSGFGRYAVAPVYKKLGFDVDLVTPRDHAAVDQLLASKLDLVSVHSPPFMHHEHVMKAFDRGIPVLCDKPFGKNVTEARAMRDRAKKDGILNFLNLEIRLKPSYAKIIEVARSGTVGAPVHMHWTFFSNGFRGRPHGWLNDRELGGGWIGAFGSHLIDLNRCLFGCEVAKCGGVTRIEVKKRPDRDGKERVGTAEDAYSAWFLMENGGTANHDTANAAAVPLPPRVVILCENGTLELVNDTKIIIRRAVDLAGLTNEERIQRGMQTGDANETIDIPPTVGEVHESGLTPWFTIIKDSLQSKQQITSPTFDDGVIIAETMEMLRANTAQM
jgi:predicted dehydrogenase